MKSWVKKLGIILLLVIALISFIVWYLFNEKFTDMNDREQSFSVDAKAFIKEFQQNDSLSNAKYKEKIITVSGLVSEVESLDSIVNVKMIDTATDAYIIFGFQNEQISAVKNLKEGEKVSIKGSCSGGAYSDILETHAIDFKRCVLSDKQ